MKISFACSSGGHLNQLLQIIGYLPKDVELSFVSIRRPDSVTRLADKKTEFVSDLNKTKISALPINLLTSAKAALRLKPDIIVTNGAGAVYFFARICRKLFGTKILFIESFARITAPSSFGRMIVKHSQSVLYQWKTLESYYPSGRFSGTIFTTKGPQTLSVPQKITKIAVMLGSSEFVFDRLLRMVSSEFSGQNVYIWAQTGHTLEKFPDIDGQDWVRHDELIARVKESDLVICHAGTGMIMNSLSMGKGVIVVPREESHNEHDDDHQADTAEALARLGAIKIVRTSQELKAAVAAIQGTTATIELASEFRKIFQEELQKLS